MEKKIPKSRAGIRKLLSGPQKVILYTQLKKAGDKFVPVEKSGVEVWMHPLTRDEWHDTEAVWVEAYRRFKARGGSEEDSQWKANRVQQTQHLFYCLRVGQKDGSERLMTEMEASQLDPLEVERLVKKYDEFFVPTKEDLGNSFRARLGQASETRSTSPTATSPAP